MKCKSYKFFICELAYFSAKYHLNCIESYLQYIFIASNKFQYFSVKMKRNFRNFIFAGPLKFSQPAHVCMSHRDISRKFYTSKHKFILISCFIYYLYVIQTQFFHFIMLRKIFDRTWRFSLIVADIAKQIRLLDCDPFHSYC